MKKKSNTRTFRKKCPQDETDKKDIPVVTSIKKRSLGCMKGTGRIVGDVTAPMDQKWDAAC